MKQQYELFIAGIWGLHLSSYIISSIPYLQALSLILAITVSLATMFKMMKNNKKGDKQKLK